MQNLTQFGRLFSSNRQFSLSSKSEKFNPFVVVIVVSLANLAISKGQEAATQARVTDKVLVPDNGEEKRVSKSSRAALPPLTVKVLIKKGGSVQPSTLKHLKVGPDLSNLLSALPQKSFQRAIGFDAGGTIADLGNADEVQSVEIVRPPHVDPIETVLAPPPLPGMVNAPLNLNARKSHLVPEFTAAYPPALGQPIVGAVFDGGAVRATHQEFRFNGASRISLRTTKPIDVHATHVAGTMAAQGVVGFEEAQGMAPRLSLLSFDWNNDVASLAASANGITVSNHSYGPQCGWARIEGAWYWWGDNAPTQVEDARFGKYTSDNASLDEALSQNQRLVTVVAAGNDRDDQPSQQPVKHYVIGLDQSNNPTWVSSTKVRKADGFDQGGLDTICGLGLSKNAICVGAVHDILNGTGAIVSTNFSSWGPADDGRVKPDLVANGYGLLSTSSASDDAYVEISGTSMASPTCAGIVALLAEHFAAKKQRVATSAELKAALIHTAVDAETTGPDPITGWGAINALRAGDLIASKNGDSLNLGEASSTQNYAKNLVANGRPIRVSIVWIDPAAEPNTKGLDDATPTLKNDLDLRLIAPDGTLFYPYRLDRSNPLQPAKHDGPNHVDNVEVVDAPSSPGNWRIEVAGSALQADARQSFAIAISGLQ